MWSLNLGHWNADSISIRYFTLPAKAREILWIKPIFVARAGRGKIAGPTTLGFLCTPPKRMGQLEYGAQHADREVVNVDSRLPPHYSYSFDPNRRMQKKKKRKYSPNSADVSKLIWVRLLIPWKILRKEILVATTIQLWISPKHCYTKKPTFPYSSYKKGIY